MNGVMKKISRKKVAVASMIVVIVVFSVAYAIIQTRTAFAILTTPPPGIPGPYYVTAEAKIYGPVVDLAAIKSKMGGTYASDYTYVEWGTNPFYRVYIDNTLQEVSYGQLIDVLDRFSPWTGYPQEENLKSTFDSLKNSGAIDPSSVRGNIQYFGNFPGSIFGFNSAGDFTLNMTTDSWKAVVAHARKGYTSGISPYPPYNYYYYETDAGVSIRLNGSSIFYFAAPNTGDNRLMNASGNSFGYGLYCFGINIWKNGGSNQAADAAVVLYVGSATNVKTSMGCRRYDVTDSPGTGFVSKYLSPSSPVAGSTVNVTVRLDPPSAANMNITDYYPNSFTWASVDVLLEKFKVGVGFEESAYVNVVPTPEGSNMKFTIYYNQAPSILQSLLSDEYIYLTYSLRVPDVAGEYTLPAASMSYLVPTP
jgi:hypothetical protein